MAKVTIEFKRAFETWAAHKVETGQFTPDEMDEFRAFLRADLEDGPDRFRRAIRVWLADDVEVSAAINDCAERHRFWGDFFAAEVEAINGRRSGVQR